MARLGTATPTRDTRAEQLVRVVEVNLGKLADPQVELSLDALERLQRALLRGYEANTGRLLAMSVRARIVDEVGA